MERVGGCQRRERVPRIRATEVFSPRTLPSLTSITVLCLFFYWGNNTLTSRPKYRHIKLLIDPSNPAPPHAIHRTDHHPTILRHLGGDDGKMNNSADSRQGPTGCELEAIHYILSRDVTLVCCQFISLVPNSRQTNPQLCDLHPIHVR